MFFDLKKKEKKNCRKIQKKRLKNQNNHTEFLHTVDVKLYNQIMIACSEIIDYL